jgi:hypothetical protein
MGHGRGILTAECRHVLPNSPTSQTGEHIVVDILAVDGGVG